VEGYAEAECAFVGVDLEGDQKMRVLLPVIDGAVTVGAVELEADALAVTGSMTAGGDDRGVDIASRLEQSPHILAYAKNAGGELKISYESRGSTRTYNPDFVALVGNGSTWLIDIRSLVEEEDRAVAKGASKWVKAVNNNGAFGVWKHVTCRDADALECVLAHSPPAGDDGSREIDPAGRVPENAREWWERAVSPPPPRGKRRRGPKVGWLVSAQIVAPLDPDKASWAIPCHCGRPWCDGVRYVSHSGGGSPIRFIHPHPNDPEAARHLESFIRVLARAAVEVAMRDLGRR
jgi:hypothetical protein